LVLRKINKIVAGFKGPTSKGKREEGREVMAREVEKGVEGTYL